MQLDPDEIAGGVIDHALILALPSAMIRTSVYVHPATHKPLTSGPAAAPPYGTRLRLLPGFEIEAGPYSEPVKVILRALKKHGFILDSSGIIPLSGLDDSRSANSWASLGIDPVSLTFLEMGNFDVVAYGTPIPAPNDCVRTDPLFADRFESGNMLRWSPVAP
jgi:hypothetical protein